MSKNGKGRASEDNLPEDEQPILLTKRVPSSGENEDEVINLDEVVDEDSDEPILLTEELSSPGGDDTEVVDLTEVIEADSGDAILLTEMVSSSGEGQEDVIDLNEVVGDNAAIDGAVEGVPGLSLTPQQIDRALERVVEKLYGRRIESLLLEVVKNKVSADIEKIKKALHDG
ncbi:MAG: hypothetical protein CSB33_05395 [Desulfobacterales bacterium]|nr:MAG: hypothetical protein CSB33_05395 [Desulfobacterales bacterium]